METRIAENIRAYRKQRGLTQEQLAEVLGVSVGAVYKWESRSSLPELRLIMEMADFFDVSVDALLGYRIKDNRLDATEARIWRYHSEKNREGLDCRVSIQREGNVVTMATENLGIVIASVTTVKDEVEELYVALTGDQCALTNIRIECI